MRWDFVLLSAFISPVAARIYDEFSELPPQEWDFIIAGGGTAGLVVANRLTEDPSVHVLVIEAGESHQGILDLEVPWLSSRLRQPAAPFDWNTSSTAQPGLNGRSIIYARARVLGGSSSHNGMIWIRGSSDDYDKWAEITGDEEWSWKNMVPYLKKVERWTTAPGHGPEEGDFDPRFHGFKGPLGISLSNVIQPTDPLIIQTTKDLPEVFHFIEDPNAGRPIGIAWTQFSIANGTRSSAATAYLDPVLDRPNLSVLVNNYVTKIMETAKGSFRAVEFAQNQTSLRQQLTAKKELILSAGVVGTPQILLNSGIGDPVELEKVGVKPVFSLPDVGKNFSTEPMIPFSWAANTTVINLNTNETASDEALQQWIESRTGLMTGGSESLSAYFRLPDDSPAFVGNDDPSAGPNTPHFGIGVNANGYFSSNTDPTLSVLIEVSEPASRGFVGLKSTDPFELPLLDLGFYSALVDLAIVKEGFKVAIQFVTAPAWKEFTLDRLTPPPGVAVDSDNLVEFIRNSTGTASHGIGTSAMSPRGAKNGVVDPDLRVKGLSGLRIVDAGVIPRSPSANTQAPVYAIAERASDLIKKAWGLK
ncbi:Oxygen-dependent choline dehydrogenase [Leucoagaricus sp. SymC.cos]|nr:Oxygen-dependent choline dehydrogenase [Leucoagaricus sp. SymC.cos]